LHYGCGMASITLKELPEHLHKQLTREAEANHRSLNGEVIRRLELSFDLEAACNTTRDAQWIQEAIASGPEASLTRAKFQAAVRQGLEHAKKTAA
jgi:plasmid stability protein